MEETRESIDVTLGGKVWHLRIRARELCLIAETFRGQTPEVNPLMLLDQLAVFDPISPERLATIEAQLSEEFPPPADGATTEDVEAQTQRRLERSAELHSNAQTWHLGSLFALQTLLWAALRREDPKLTREQAADLMDTFAGNLAELALLVRMAWSVGGLGSARSEPKNAEAEAATVTRH